MLKKIIVKYKKRLIVLGSLWIIYLIIIFSLGYKIPWFDKHPDWGYFPNHTNPNIVIEEIYSNVDFESLILQKDSSLVVGCIKGHKEDTLVIFNNEFKQLYKKCIMNFNSYRFTNPILVDTNQNYIVLPIDENDTLKYFAVDINTLKEVNLPTNYFIRKDTIDKFNIRVFIYNNHISKIFQNIKFLGNSIVENEFHPGTTLQRFNLSLSSTGGSPNGLEMPKEYWSYFSQKYIGYFEIRLGSENISFKSKNDKDLRNFLQFNKAKTDADTLYIAHGKIYKLYKK